MIQPDINAGEWYLRGTGEGSWDVCEPIIGKAIAEVEVDLSSGEITIRGDSTGARVGAQAVRRYLAREFDAPR